MANHLDVADLMVENAQLREALEICKGCLEACAAMHPDNTGIAKALSAARATLAVVGSPKQQ